MPRPQFSLKTLLWLMAVVGAFFAGGEWARRRWAAERSKLLSDVKLWQDLSEDQEKQFMKYHDMWLKLERARLSNARSESGIQE